MDAKFCSLDPIEKTLVSIRQDISELKELLKPLPQTKSDRQGGKELAREVTQYSYSALTKMTMNRAIPFEKRGGRLWFSEETLLKWMALGQPHWGELKANQRINEHLKK